jgi:prepilin-type N-terminal cleavage/methylation domain-containing protein
MIIRKRKKTSGFTLIELLVVIAIIALLSSVVMSSIAKARAKARQVRRIADVNSIVKALALTYDSNGGYPSSGTSSYCIGLDSAETCWGGIFTGNTTLKNLLLPYMPSAPKDPFRTTGKGDRYLYADSLKNVAQNCANVVIPYPRGPFILWEPDNTTPMNADCQGYSFNACCGSAPGGCLTGAGYFCAYQIR